MELKDMKWKYLRENDQKYFDPNRNTALADYLAVIFPEYTFIYNANIPSDIQKNRGATSIVRYRPDARCEELDLIIEFDGLAHYQDQVVILADQKRDSILKELGYRVVRIPYWIQLSNGVIEHLFGKRVEEEMCTLPYSFYNPDTDDPCLSIVPGNMSVLGLQRFVSEVMNMPADIQLQVYEDLIKCAEALHRSHPEMSDSYQAGCCVCPAGTIEQWGIDYLYVDDLEYARSVEHAVFHTPYSGLSYTGGGFRSTDVWLKEYVELRSHIHFSPIAKCPKELNDKFQIFLNKCSWIDEAQFFIIRLAPWRNDASVFAAGVSFLIESHEDLYSNAKEFAKQYSEVYLEEHDGAVTIWI